jgi:YHS domain-containing protein
MHPTLVRHFGLAAPLAAALLCASGCSTPGRCVGAAGASVQTSDQKILLNLDRDGVAIHGYDPVAFFTDAKPVMGDPKIRSTHGGAIYWFATAAHKAMFDANPAKYEPQFGGWCAYAASIDALSPIEPKYWEIVDGRLLLQHNQKAWDLWHKEASSNLVKADKNWPGLVDKNGAPPRTLLNVDEKGLALAGYDPTSYFLDNKPLKGDPTLARTYQGATYYFVDAAHKNVFEKDPAKYVPQFGGFCGYAASIKKVSPVNPEIWQLVNGRLVLQHTPEAYRLFNQDVAGNNTKAESNWPGLAHRQCGG